jgi:5-methylcytosine-specific restriction endonuclease McrA
MIDRDKVKSKFNGLCAYTGKPLCDDWQVDHITPKSSVIWFQPEETRLQFGIKNNNPDNIDNLLPCLRIINHYKRDMNLESFRKYMKSFHVRLSKLPKKTNSTKAIKRIEYMNNVANAFGIDINNGFDGLFFFERKGDCHE